LKYRPEAEAYHEELLVVEDEILPHYPFQRRGLLDQRRLPRDGLRCLRTPRVWL